MEGHDCGHPHRLRDELRAHLPYTAAFAFAGAVAALWLSGERAVAFGEAQFHASHFLHVASATAAMTTLVTARARLGALSAITLLASAVVLCALADTLIPWLGLVVLGHTPHMHLCAVEHPVVVGTCALAGIALGLLARRTWGSCSHWLHSAHILIANVAAVLFILKNVPDVRAGDALGVAAILTAAVGLTCICGDVVIPTLLTAQVGKRTASSTTTPA